MISCQMQYVCQKDSLRYWQVQGELIWHRQSTVCSQREILTVHERVWRWRRPASVPTMTTLHHQSDAASAANNIQQTANNSNYTKHYIPYTLQFMTTRWSPSTCEQTKTVRIARIRDRGSGGQTRLRRNGGAYAKRLVHGRRLCRGR